MKVILYKFILLVVVSALSLPCLVYAGGPLPAELKIEAKKQVATLKGFSIDSLHSLGFDSLSDVDNAELGEGFEVYIIDALKLLDETTPQDIQSHVSSTNVWYFPVLIDGKAKSLLQLRLKAGKWVLVGIFPLKLAKEMVDIRAAWPESAGYQYRFVKIQQASSDIIELFLKGKAIGVIPLSSYSRIDKKGKSTEEFNPRDIRDPKEVLTTLRPVVKQNIEMYKDRKAPKPDRSISE